MYMYGMHRFHSFIWSTPPHLPTTTTTTILHHLSVKPSALVYIQFLKHLPIYKFTIHLENTVSILNQQFTSTSETTRRMSHMPMKKRMAAHCMRP